ncbi:TonB family protein [uncultured Haemophilus sp.]|uniref:energy transducer TonB family protein n=1 Tax=uncultured Haemophilus sp. TaxID=237779 RepID=UPI00258B9165|nr:TonB family protein [uncultured Haemophilus sp.]
MNKRNSRIGLAGSIVFHTVIVSAILIATKQTMLSDQIDDMQEVSSISMEMLAGVAEQPQVAVAPDVDETAKEEAKPEEKAEEKIEEPKPDPITEPEPIKKVVKKEKPKEPPKPKEPAKEKPKKVEKPVKALEKGKEVKQGIVAKAQPNIPQSQTPKEGVANGSQNGKGNVGSSKGAENGNAAKGNDSSGVGNGSVASGTEINAYKSALQRALQRQANNAYPTRERMMRKMGTVTLSFTVSPAGQLTNVSVVSSSGNSNLDAAAVKAAQSTKTSPPPVGFPNHVTVPVKFSIE